MVLSGVRDIAGAPPGVYRDGGVIDYHLDLPAAVDDRLVLYLHFFDWLKPGWFDKSLSWRRVDPDIRADALKALAHEQFVTGTIHNRTGYTLQD